jgi:hypothetical protein
MTRISRSLKLVATGFALSCQNRFTPKEIEFDFTLYPQRYGPSLERYESLSEVA